MGSYRVDPCLLNLLWFSVAVDCDRSTLRDNDGVSFGEVRWHCSPAMQFTLCWLLSTVHSQQQECTPGSQECTVDGEASET